MMHQLTRELAKREIEYFMYCDIIENIKGIAVKTTDENEILKYEFTVFGGFIRMYYVFGNFKDEMVSMMKSNLATGRYTNIVHHNGKEAAKVSF